MLANLNRKLLFAAALLFALPASAQFVNFEFCGESSISTPMALKGTPVLGRFSWDASATGVVAYPGAFERDYWPPQVGPFTFVVGDHTVTSDNVWVIVRDHWTIDINAYSPVIDGTLFTQAYFGVRLASTKSVFQDGRLPLDLNLADFDNSSFNYFQLYSGVVANDLMLDVTLRWLGHPEERPGRSERRDCHSRQQR